MFRDPATTNRNNVILVLLIIAAGVMHRLHKRSLNKAHTDFMDKLVNNPLGSELEDMFDYLHKLHLIQEENQLEYFFLVLLTIITVVFAMI